MATATMPQLTASGIPIDTSTDSFGALISSIDLINDVEALRERMRAEGYLYLPGYLMRDDVLAAREVIATRLAAAGYLAPGTPAPEMIPGPDASMTQRPDLVQDNMPLRTVLYDGRMITFYERFLGGEVRHFDYTWMRVVAPGHGTPPHMDVVFMGRGTTNLYTTWTPLGDIPI